MFCDSHYISRFAAFFIDARAKRSFVESFHSIFKSDTGFIGHGCGTRGAEARLTVHVFESGRPETPWHDNDPSAGSPTETLLRLLLPLNDQV
jgi:hypothetical protein